MILLVDAGNTRIKWGCLEDGRIEQVREWRHKERQLDDIVPLLDSLAPQPARMVVSNVAGFEMARVLTQYAQDHQGMRPEFVQVEREALGVSVAYRDEHQLGVDRWVAMIGAFGQYHAPLCVVDAGTALTIDGLDREGRHLGGMIAPGVHLASQVLNHGTSDIAAKRHAQDRELDLFMDNTDGAVQAGALFSVVALVEKAVEEMSQRLSARPQVIVTGGDGERVRDRLGIPAQFVPDLVLRGLRLITKRES